MHRDKPVGWLHKRFLLHTQNESLQNQPETLRSHSDKRFIPNTFSVTWQVCSKQYTPYMFVAGIREAYPARDARKGVWSKIAIAKVLSGAETCKMTQGCQYD